MAVLNVVEFVTLDGVVQGFGSPDEDRDGGFQHGGWGAPYRTEAEFASAVESLASTTGYLFGRRTFEKMAEFWPHQPDTNPMAAHLNATPKHVATRTLTDLGWRNARRLDGDLTTAVSALKRGTDGTIVVLGSGALVQQLVAADLIDGYQLFLHPLVLGSGKRLFGTLESPRRLRLVNAVPTPTGVVMLSYEIERA